MSTVSVSELHNYRFILSEGHRRPSVSEVGPGATALRLDLAEPRLCRWVFELTLERQSATYDIVSETLAYIR